MKFFTISEASNLLLIRPSTISNWFLGEINPLEIISNTNIEKVSGKWMIPESVINNYLDFKTNYITTKEVSRLLPLSILDIDLMMENKYFKRFFKIGETNYIHKQDVLALNIDEIPLPSYYSIAHLEKEFSLDRSTIVDYINRDKFPGSTKYKFAWYVPKASFENFKKEREQAFEGINLSEYYSLEQAAKILEVKSRKKFYNMLKNNSNTFPFIYYGSKSECLVLKKSIDEHKKFIDENLHNYYTSKEVIDLLSITPAKLQRLSLKWKECKWGIFHGIYQRIIPQKTVEEFLNSKNSYRTLTFENADEVFHHTIRSLKSNSTVPLTISVCIEFFEEKMNFSLAHINVKKMQAREYGLFCKELIELITTEIFYYTDAKLKMLFNRLSSGNYKMHLSQFLNFCKETSPDCMFSYDYIISSKKYLKFKEKEIYSFDEFVNCYKYIKNVENHIIHALKSRRYANTWLYVSLHFTNAWRSQDYLDVPYIQIQLAGDFSFDWFLKGNRLNSVQAQKIINQFSSIRLFTSKTGALNRFTTNLDILIPLATMIIISDLHRQDANDKILMKLTTKNYARGEKVDAYFFNNYKFNFRSLKMNRSFITHLFHYATQSSEYNNIALSLPQAARSHTTTDSTSIYIQMTNKDGPISNITEHLFNRGHFGHLYSLLIETMIIKKQDSITLDQQTLLIQKLKENFTTPLNIENFGYILQSQHTEKETLALQILQMPYPTLEQKIEQLYKDMSPSNSEHIQCFNYPHCITPNTSSCVGCIYSVPKNYFLISIYEEIKKKLEVLNNTTNSAVAEREYSWILKYLSLLQEAVDTYGKEYVSSFIEFQTLFKESSLAFIHYKKISSVKNTAIDGDDEIVK